MGMQMAQALDVNLQTVRNVEAVLRTASVPVTRYYILQKLKEKGTSTNGPRLELALEYLSDHHMIFEGSRGVQWTAADTDKLRRALALSKRVG